MLSVTPVMWRINYSVALIFHSLSYEEAKICFIRSEMYVACNIKPP